MQEGVLGLGDLGAGDTYSMVVGTGSRSLSSPVQSVASGNPVGVVFNATLLIKMQCEDHLMTVDHRRRPGT